jgi:hypothetical protein
MHHAPSLPKALHPLKAPSGDPYDIILTNPSQSRCPDGFAQPLGTPIRIIRPSVSGYEGRSGLLNRGLAPGQAPRDPLSVRVPRVQVVVDMARSACRGVGRVGSAPGPVISWGCSCADDRWGWRAGALPYLGARTSRVRRRDDGWGMSRSVGCSRSICPGPPARSPG